MAKGALSPNWLQIKLEFLGGTNLADLARIHGIKESTVRMQASRGNWQQERDELWRKVMFEARKTLVEKHRAELEQANADDLVMAKALRTTAFNAIKDANDPDPEKRVRLKPAEVRALSAVADAAQRIGRLALGAATEQHVHEMSGPGGAPIATDNVNRAYTPEQYKAALQDVLEKY